MKIHYSVTLAMLAGFGLGAVAAEGLHAQAKPPVYQVVEIEPIKAAGGKFLAAGGKTTTIEGEPPKARVVIQQWDRYSLGRWLREFYWP
jgi:uncharacterized protein (DUF1330 family)